MIKLRIDSIKKEHTLYSYIQHCPSDTYCFCEDADIVIISLEDPTSQHRINELLINNKKFFIYFEHISSFVNDLSNEFIQQVLLNSLFLGIITHSTSTLNTCKALFPVCKCYYLPVGIHPQEKQHSDRKINFIFWSSWNDINNNNFYGRGGFYADEIFCIIKKNFDITLTIRSPIQLNCMNLYPESVANIHNYLSQKELFDLYAKSDIYLLASAQAHFLTIPEAMSFGMPIIGNNNWGFEENVLDGFDGIKEDCNAKPELCRIRESIDFDYVEKISNRIMAILENKDKLIQMSNNSIKTQLTYHNINDYPEKLSSILDSVSTYS